MLRHGFKFYGKTFRMAWFRPAHGLDEEAQALDAQNALTITRQVRGHPGKHDTVDLLSGIIEVLNERFGTALSEADRLFFQQIKEKACNSEQIVRTALANPLDKFQLGIRKLIEDLMIECMGENDVIGTRYMADKDFQRSAFPILAREIFESVRSNESATSDAIRETPNDS